MGPALHDAKQHLHVFIRRKGILEGLQSRPIGLDGSYHNSG